MNIIDRYIIRKFLFTFFFTMFISLLVSITIDISEKIDVFLKDELTLKYIILNYFIHFIFYYGNLFLPIVLFITTIFVTTRLAANNELITCFSSGLSFNRVLFPYFVSSSIIFIIMLIFSHLVLPDSNRIRKQFEEKYVDNIRYKYDDKLSKQVENDTYIFLETYYLEDSTGYNFIYDKFDESMLVYRLKANRIEWDGSKKMYRLYDYEIRYIEYDRDTIDDPNKIKEIVKKGYSMDTLFSFKPEELIFSKDIEESMNTFKLTKFIETEKQRGSDNINKYLLEKYKRTSIPFSAYILTFIGYIICYRKKRGGIGINMTIGFALVAFYIFLFQVVSMFSIKAYLSPLISAWMLNFLYLLILLFLYFRLRL